MSYAFHSLPKECRPIELLLTLDNNDDGGPGFTQRFEVRGRAGKIRVEVPAAFPVRPDVAKASAITAQRARSDVAVVLIR